MKCRHCNSLLEDTFLDLGFAPPSNAYLQLEDLNKPEVYYPLKLKVCKDCWLVQTEDYAAAEELFSSDYAYFSSTSKSWLSHAAQYAQNMIDMLSLDSNSQVIEIASNDGYLLRNFVTAEIPCLGIEPTSSTAEAAENMGIPVLREFFGENLANKLVSEGRLADLVVGNNVYAHVPDINDFTRGMKVILKPGGTITLEFPHLLNLIKYTQFDTVYHEHFSYLSLYSVDRIFKSANLRIWNVEKLPTHGGSLRVYGCHLDDLRDTQPAVFNLLEEEKREGLQDNSIYQSFQEKANQVKNELLYFLLEQRKLGKTIVAYGAAAKGNTLLNYAGVKSDLLPLVCDAAISKQGKFLPGSHIPVQSPALLRETQPDYVIILPWNLREEIVGQLSYVREWGGQFVTAIPAMKIK